MVTKIHRLILGAVAALIVGSAGPATARPIEQGPLPPKIDTRLVEQVRQATQGTARIAIDDHSGKIRFISTEKGHPLPRAADVAPNATPEQAARGFLRAYGQLFGLNDQ